VVVSKPKRNRRTGNVAEAIRALGRKALASLPMWGKRRCGELVQKTLDNSERIDILVNNAGMNPVLSPLWISKNVL